MTDPILLVTPYLLIIVSTVSIVGNGIILITVTKNSSLRQKDCLYLIAPLAAFDFITGCGTVPYAINMIIHENANCSTGSILLSIPGHMAGTRAAQLLTVLLGLDRIYAVYFPMEYRVKNHLNIARIVTAVCMVCGCLDAAMLPVGTDLKRIMPTCVAVVAANPKYRLYKLISDFVINLCILIVYAIVLLKIRTLKIRSLANNNQSNQQLQQATITISFILMVSVLLMTLPSFLNTFDIVTGFGIFTSFGPLLGTFNTLNGAVNIFIYAWKHEDFKAAIRMLWNRKTNKVNAAQISQMANTQSIKNRTNGDPHDRSDHGYVESKYSLARELHLSD